MKEPTTGQRAEGMGGALVARSGEMAMTASAARAKAEIEAAYVMAIHHPRNIEDARQKILAACRRPRFAETAIYAKPVGNTTARGPSIRFAEAAVQAMHNIRVDTSTIFEDDNVRMIQVSVTDLEANLSYGRPVTLQKTVERSKVKPGQEVLGERTNTSGNKVFIVRATEDDLLNKEAAARSKIIRNEGLRLIPGDIIEEAMDVCRETQRSGAGDAKSAHKKIGDAFAGLGIMPSDLERYLGCKLTQANISQIDDLRGIFAAIKDGEARWSDYVSAGPAPARATVDIDQIKAGDASTHTESGEPIIPLSQPDPDEPPAPTDENPPAGAETPFQIWEDTITFIEEVAVKPEARIAAEDAFLKEWDTRDPASMPAHFAGDLKHWVSKKLLPILKKQGMIQK